MGAIVGGVASLFGGRKRRREQSAANKEFGEMKSKLQNFKFKDVGEGLVGQGYDATVNAAPTLEGLGLGGPAQSQMGELGEAAGYEAQGYDATGYNAAQTNVGQLMRGEDAGLANTMNNLQVSTAGAEMKAQEIDDTLAAQQDLVAQTGAGGATALVAGAAKAKAGISADIDKQVKQNEMLRAQAEGQLQKDQLAQENLASKFDLGQQQFNVGQDNQARQFTAQAQNQAAQFGAAAANQAAQFGASGMNQFGLQGFDATNRMNMFNVGQQQDLTRDQLRMAGQFGLAGMDAQNRAAEFGASAANQMALNRAKFTEMAQQNQYGQAQDLFGIASGRKASADQARKSATNALVGGIGAALAPGGGIMSSLMG